MRRSSRYSRRAAAVVLAVVAIPVMIIFASLAIDIGQICRARAELQNAADAAALAGDGRWNAVEVTTRRYSDGPNHAVPLYFATYFGVSESNVKAKARAAFIDRMAGYKFKNGALIPFTIQEDAYKNMVASGSDLYSFNGTSVASASDQVREVELYPNGTSSGNFGTVNVGVGNEGTATLGDQITNGLSAAALSSEFGTSELRFYDSSGVARTYTGTGNPGISAGMENAVESRVGQVVGFFLYRSVSGTGSTSTYTISGIRFARVMYVHLSTPKSLVVQPVAYTYDGVIVDPQAPSTDGAVGRVMLVQ